MRSPSRPATPGAGRGSSRPPQTAVLRRVARSGAWYWASVLTGTGGAFVVSVIVGRTLGLAGLGRFSYFTWVVRLSSTVLALGLQAMLGRFVAQYLGSPTPGHARGLVRLAIRANVLLAPVAAGSVAIFVLWRAHSPGLAFVLSIAAALALAVVQLEGVLGGVRDFSTLARAALVSAVAQVILAVSAAVVGVGWQGYLAFQALTMVVAVLFLSRGARRHTRAWRLVPLPRTEVVRVLRFAGTMGLVGLLGEVVWGRPELFFLDRYHGSGEVGLYSAALRLSTLVLALPYLAHRVLVPEFSWLLGSGRDAEMRATFQTVCKFTALIALPIGLGGAAVSDLILSVVYGQQFEGAAGAASILLAGSAVTGLAAPVTAALMSSPHAGLLAPLGAGLALVNLVLDLVFIPRWGLVGGAAATILAQAMGVACLISLAARRLELRYPFRQLVAPLASGMLAAGVARLVSAGVSGAASLALAAPAGAVVYGAAALATGALNPGELSQVWRRAPERDRGRGA